MPRPRVTPHPICCSDSTGDYVKNVDLFVFFSLDAEIGRPFHVLTVL